MMMSPAGTARISRTGAKTQGRARPRSKPCSMYSSMTVISNDRAAAIGSFQGCSRTGGAAGMARTSCPYFNGVRVKAEHRDDRDC